MLGEDPDRAHAPSLVRAAGEARYSAPSFGSSFREAELMQ